MSYIGTRELSRELHVAKVVKSMGWGVGTYLSGDEGRGPDVIKITAVGEKRILAKQVLHNGFRTWDDERTWTLAFRDWTEVEVPDDDRD